MPINIPSCLTPPPFHSNVTIELNTDGAVKSVAISKDGVSIPITGCIELKYKYSADLGIPEVTLKLVSPVIKVADS